MGKWLRPLLAWGAAAALLALAWHLKHPLMYWLRPWETPILLITGMAGGAAGLAGRPAQRRLLGAALLAMAICALYREIELAAMRASVLAAGSDARAVGAHFVVGFQDFAEVEPLVERGLVGGLYLTRRNLRGTTPAAVATAIARLQAKRRALGLPPLIVAADQEGGEVSHLSPWLTAMPPLASLVDAGPPEQLADRARAYGRAQGTELAALGVNLNFGPVVDLRPATTFAGDRLTRIAHRAIAADPATVETVAQGYHAGLADAGVGATFKHFPGLGRVRADTHFSRASLAHAPVDLESDWLPFRAASPQGAVMVGHVTLTAVDPDHAASHSLSVISGLLRGEIGHTGLVVTDDLNMGAVYGRGIGRVAGEALAAGADLVLVSYDPDQVFRALHGAARALTAGEIDQSMLVASRQRLATFLAGHTGCGWPAGDKIATPCASSSSTSCRKARPAWTTSFPAATAKQLPPSPAGWPGNAVNSPSACGARPGPAAATS